MRPFPGFPAKTSTAPLPTAFFSLLLPHIDDLAELKVTLYILWLLSRKGEGERFVSVGELKADRNLMAGLGEKGKLEEALERACQRGSLLPLAVERQGSKEHLYFLNDPEGKLAREQMAGGKDLAGASAEEEKPATDIFTLYEQNIGLLTPIIAEELKQAELLYPPSWVEEAFQEAMALNKRNWRYISRILESWARDGKPRRDTKEKRDRERYLRGRFGHLVGR